MQPIKKLKRFWHLANKDPEALKKLESLTDEQLAVIPNAGDGKAEFFGQGTEEEYKKQQNKDKFGAENLFDI